MTCTQVLDLIDAGDLAGAEPARLEAARRHAQGCPTCGPALLRAQRLTARLRELSPPVAAPDLASTVMARIARMDHAPAVTTPSVRSDRRVQWGTTAGTLLTSGMVVGVLSASGGMFDIVRSGAGHISIGMVTKGTSPLTVVLVMIGLAVYMRSLFAPLRTAPSARRSGVRS